MGPFIFLLCVILALGSVGWQLHPCVNTVASPVAVLVATKQLYSFQRNFLLIVP